MLEYGVKGRLSEECVCGDEDCKLLGCCLSYNYCFRVSCAVFDGLGSGIVGCIVVYNPIGTLVICCT